MSAEGAEATGGEGVTLSEAEREALRGAWSAGQDTTTRVVKWIVAARVQQAEAERDAARREERMRAEDHARAWQRVAEVEAERDALRERVEALADEYDAHANRPECNDDEGWRCPECTHARVLRAALDG